MPRDKRYHTVKVLIETGHIKTFAQIFEHIPVSVIYRDMGMYYSRFKRLLQSPGLFSIAELSTLAGFIGIDPKIIIGLAYEQYMKRRK